MQTILKKEICDLLRLELMGELHQIREKSRVFEKKYNATFEEVQQMVQQQEEDFNLDDDLMEWKAYKKTEADRLKKLEDMKHERLQLA